MTAQEAYQQMLDRVNDGGAVLTTSGVHPDIPTIDEVGTRNGQRLQCTTEVRHCGFGLFMAGTPSGQFCFDGGGAMQRAQDDDGNWQFSWCPLTAKSADYAKFDDILSDLGYDRQAVKVALESLIQ